MRHVILGVDYDCTVGFGRYVCMGCFWNNVLQFAPLLLYVPGLYMYVHYVVQYVLVLNVQRY